MKKHGKTKRVYAFSLIYNVFLLLRRSLSICQEQTAHMLSRNEVHGMENNVNSITEQHEHDSLNKSFGYQSNMNLF